MKIYIYTVPVDDGAAPNPYGGVCTLAICKPNLRKIAKVDDWIIGLNSECKLIYAMKITTVQTMKEYDLFTKEHLKIKIPNKHSKNIQEQMGDSVYDFSDENITLRPSVQSRCTKDMDLAGKNVLLSSNFYYFGNQTKELPKEFDNIVNINIDFIELTENFKEIFFNWLENQNFQKNKIYSTPQVIGIISPSNREAKMSCCVRKKVEESYC